MLMWGLGVAHAQCLYLERAVHLAEAIYTGQDGASTAQLTALSRALDEIRNDHLLETLSASGQAHVFGDLRLFLTQLKLVTALEDHDFQFTKRMQDDLVAARGLLATVCTTDARLPTRSGPTETAAPSFAQVLKSQVATVVERTLSAEQIALLEKAFDLTLLIQFMAAVALCVAAMYSLHYGLFISRIVARNRRRCQIAAEVICIMTPMQGHVTILGRYGCRFEMTMESEQPIPLAISRGTYCTVKVAGQDINARLGKDASSYLHLHFHKPLENAAMSSIFKASEVPVRLDFSAITRREDHDRIFGRGTLPAGRS